MYRYEILDKYLNDVSSNTPAPGGGSVSALVGALGASMAYMSAGFTLGKEDFKDVEPQIRKILEGCKDSREELLGLMEDDIEVYEGINRAYALSKSAQEDKERRSLAIQSALKKAVDVPLKVVRRSLSILEYTNELARITNPNLISDVGVAGLLADAALKGAMLNVEINLNSLKDKEIVDKVRVEVEKAFEKAEGLISDIMKEVKNTMSKTN